MRADDRRRKCAKNRSEAGSRRLFRVHERKPISAQDVVKKTRVMQQATRARATGMSLPMLHHRTVMRSEIHRQSKQHNSDVPPFHRDARGTKHIYSRCALPARHMHFVDAASSVTRNVGHTVLQQQHARRSHAMVLAQHGFRGYELLRRQPHSGGSSRIGCSFTVGSYDMTGVCVFGELSGLSVVGGV
jgi:hypothetical protein